MMIKIHVSRPMSPSAIRMFLRFTRSPDSIRFHPALADGAYVASTCYARKLVPHFPEVDSLRLVRHVSCYRLRLITKRSSARAALRRWLRDDEVWNHEASATWSSRPSPLFLSLFRFLSFSLSLSLILPLIIDDVPAASFSSFSLDTLLFELQPDEWPILYSLPPAFSTRDSPS